MHEVQTGCPKLNGTSGLNLRLLIARHLQRNQKERFDHFTLVHLNERNFAACRIYESHGASAATESFQRDQSLVSGKKRRQTWCASHTKLKLWFKALGGALGVI